MARPNASELRQLSDADLSASRDVAREESARTVALLRLQTPKGCLDSSGLQKSLDQRGGVHRK